MHRKFQVGCPCCCGQCSTFQDLFTQGGRDPLPTDDYTEQASTWSFGLSDYIVPDSDGATFTLNRSNAKSQIIRAWWKASNTGACKILHNWLDANNHAYIKCTPADSRYMVVEIHAVVAGVDSTLAGPTTFDSSPIGQHLIWTGYCNSYLQAIPRIAGTGVYLSANVGDSGGAFCGIEAVGTGFQLETFDWSSCISASGLDGWARFAYQIDIYGDGYYYANPDSYVVTISGAPGQTPTVYSRNASPGTWWLSFDYPSRLLRVYYTEFSTTPIREYRLALDCRDLTALSNLTIPWYAGTGSTTTCKVTAIA